MNIARCAAVVALGWSVFGSLTASAQVVPTAPSQSEPLVTLSPFILREDQDAGYAPTETLSGTRLRTAVKDVASAMTIITGDLMKDLGALNYADVLDFVPSTSIYTNTADDANSNGPRSGTPFVVRGYRSGSISTNFFTSFTKPDAYNMSRLTFTRGPNSILFGNGTLGGTSSSTTKRARTDRAFQNGQLGVGSWNTYRATFDVNQPVGKRAAVRVAGVWGDGDGWREKDFNQRKGAFATTTFRPWRNTEIRLDGEYLEIQKQTGMTTLNDRLSGWNGALAYSTPTALRGAAAAVVTAATAAGVNELVVDSPLTGARGTGTDCAPSEMFGSIDGNELAGPTVPRGLRRFA